MIRLRDERGYTLIELMFVIVILGMVTSSLYLVKENIYNTWRFNKLESVLEQELRISLNMVVTNLQQAKFIKTFNNNPASKIAYIDQKGEKRVIYYRAGGGLCLDYDYNIISNKVNSFDLRRVGNLLYITLKIEDKGKEELLKTAIKIRAEQL
ncbi:prepilin-type N-terminal cleavage/methylation domain-containing protein [Orenia metallireducens]|jgi:prepilin-type N-terminal cleavage/methylation domain-containing protein|uniref:Prepilin-type N-terminal cleavage/methylation domain-containing protein n=1 Tax=Orenia metallireducens TaxID=1413210 RepID=A0A285I596_9FIRM|nr:type II secretion system protein [Orenia metallireducens]PRX19724.1 prepilin-type N-terminal cleavage/methylation domain-containing protein [Orenia metallireducens]SNY43165.1 prepilin-type N-terminal cleavage/methylation domain-containing protein [Orenia metallireducens]